MSNLAYSFMNNGGAAQAANNNIKQFTTSGAPNVSGYFNGANPNAAGAAPYSSAQAGLLAQLQAQANGAGPNLAAQQLQQGTQANIAAQMAQAAAQRGNQNPGAELSNLANQAAMTRQQAAGQAAQLAGQQQLGAESQLGGLAGQGYNQAAQQAQFNAQSQQALGNLLNSQWATANQLNEAGQNAYNSNVAGLLGAQGQTGNQLFGGGLQALGTVGAALAKTGGLFDKPTHLMVGEHGPEAVVPLDGSQGDPHDFLDEMIKQLKKGQEGVAAPKSMGKTLKKKAA